MAHPQRWSVTLAASGRRHPRWLDENGHFSSDPSRALRLITPEVAVQRIQAFLAVHGWETPQALERFRLVPAPTPLESRTPPRSRAWRSLEDPRATGFREAA
jgi:hypothetical protein